MNGSGDELAHSVGVICVLSIVLLVFGVSLIWWFT